MICTILPSTVSDSSYFNNKAHGSLHNALPPSTYTTAQSTPPLVRAASQAHAVGQRETVLYIPSFEVLVARARAPGPAANTAVDGF